MVLLYKLIKFGQSRPSLIYTKRFWNVKSMWIFITTLVRWQTFRRISPGLRHVLWGKVARWKATKGLCQHNYNVPFYQLNRMKDPRQEIFENIPIHALYPILTRRFVNREPENVVGQVPERHALSLFIIARHGSGASAGNTRRCSRSTPFSPPHLIIIPKRTHAYLHTA